MGMFDSVMIPCPNCGWIHEFQSKSGECLLGVYTLKNAPQDVLYDINRHSPCVCSKCDTQYEVELEKRLVPKIVIVES